MKIKRIKRRKEIFAILIASSTIFIIFFYLSTNVSTTEYFYDFEDDEINSFPNGFVGVGRKTDNTKVVEWSLDDGHKGKVVQINYLDEIDHYNVELNTVFSKAVKGAISFDIYLVEELGIKIDICQEDLIYDHVDDITISVGYNKPIDVAVQNLRGNMEYIMTIPLQLLQWYNFKINFNCQYNEWDIEICNKNNFLVGSGSFRFYEKPLYFSQLYFATYVLGNEFYVDNVEISVLKTI